LSCLPDALHDSLGRFRRIPSDMGGDFPHIPQGQAKPLHMVALVSGHRRPIARKPPALPLP
jgi:hypothetical protein